MKSPLTGVLKLAVWFNKICIPGKRLHTHLKMFYLPVAFEILLIHTTCFEKEKCQHNTVWILNVYSAVCLEFALKVILWPEIQFWEMPFKSDFFFFFKCMVGAGEFYPHKRWMLPAQHVVLLWVLAFKLWLKKKMAGAWFILLWVTAYSALILLLSTTNQLFGVLYRRRSSFVLQKEK